MKRFNAKIDMATVTQLVHSIFNANSVFPSFLYTHNMEISFRISYLHFSCYIRTTFIFKRFK